MYYSVYKYPIIEDTLETILLCKGKTYEEAKSLQEEEESNPLNKDYGTVLCHDGFRTCLAGLN